MFGWRETLGGGGSVFRKSVTVSHPNSSIEGSRPSKGIFSAWMKKQGKKINTPIQGMLPKKTSPLLKAVTLTMMFRPWADHIRSTYIRWTTNSLLFSLYFQCCSRLIMFRHSLGDSWNAAHANMWASCGPIKLTQIMSPKLRSVVYYLTYLLVTYLKAKGKATCVFQSTIMLTKAQNKQLCLGSSIKSS